MFGAWGRGGQYKTKFEKRLQLAYAEFRKWKKDNKVFSTQPRFTASRLHRKIRAEYPSINSKAIAGKDLTRWLSQVACREAAKPSADRLTRLVAACAWTYATLLEKMEEWPLILTTEQAEEFFSIGQSHLMVYSNLRKESSKATGAHSLNRCLWQLLPKHHYLQHMLWGTRQERVNPAYFTLLCGESFVGMIARMGRLSHRATISQRVLEKWRVKFGLNVRKTNIPMQ